MSGYKPLRSDRNAELKKLDAILDRALSPLRLALGQVLNEPVTIQTEAGEEKATGLQIYNALLGAKKPEEIEKIREIAEKAAIFNRPTLEAFLNAVEKTVIADLQADTGAFRREKQKVLHAIDTGTVPTSPSLASPAAQLIWGAALIHLICTPKAQDQWHESARSRNIMKTAVWDKIENNPKMFGELVEHAFHISEDIGNKGTKIRWGAPGTWFYYQRDKAIINIDLIGTLTTGIEHTRSVMFHEIGHSKFTTKWMDRQQEIWDRTKELEKKRDLALKGKGPKPTQEEFIEYNALFAEFTLMHGVSNAAEDNNVNRYASDKRSNQQDHSYSINVINILLAGTGQFATEIRQTGEIPDYSAKDISHHGEADVPKPKGQGGQQDGSIGEKEEEKSDAAQQAQRRLNNIQHAINMCFFQRNGMFPDTEEGWKSVGVHTGIIKKDAEIRVSASGALTIPAELLEVEEGHEVLRVNLKGLPKGATLSAGKDLGKGEWKLSKDDLANLSITLPATHSGEVTLQATARITEHDWLVEDPNYPGATGQTAEEVLDRIQELTEIIELALPTSQDRMFDKVNEAIDANMEVKNKAKEELWYRYCKQYADKIIEQVQEQVKEQLEQAKQNQQGQEGEGQEGEGQEGQEGQQGQQGQGGGKGQKGQKGQGGGQGGGGMGGQQGGNSDPWPIEGIDGDQEGPGEMPDSPEEGSSGQNNGEDKGKGGGDGDEKDGDGKDGQGKGKKGDKGDQQGEGQGQGDGDGEGQEGDGQGQGGGGGEGDDEDRGYTLEELEEMRKEWQEQAAKEREERENDVKQLADPNDPNSVWASKPGDSYNLDDLPVGDWREYDKMKGLYAGPINQMSKILKKLREQKVEHQKQFAREHSLLPEDGDLGRFNPGRERDRVIKEVSGQHLDERDYERFQRDIDVPVPADDDLVVAIDLSGSMASGTAPKRPVDMAIQAACILMEAGKKAGMNVYVFGWGDGSGARMLASPDMQGQQIGSNIAAVKNTLNTGTLFAPGLGSIVDFLSRVKGPGNKMVGDTHFMVVSDGDLADHEASLTSLQSLLKHVPKCSVDWTIINSNKGNAMAKLAEEVQTKRSQKIGSQHATEPQAVQGSIIRTLEQRIRQSLQEEAIPLFEKLQMFKKAVQFLHVPGETPGMKKPGSKFTSALEEQRSAAAAQDQGLSR